MSQNGQGTRGAQVPRQLAVGETVILLHPPLRLVGVSIVMERRCQQNDTVSPTATTECCADLQVRLDALVIERPIGTHRCRKVAVMPSMRGHVFVKEPCTYKPRAASPRARCDWWRRRRRVAQHAACDWNGRGGGRCAAPRCALERTEHQRVVLAVRGEEVLL